jgi:uncharacterized membrane protein YfcA
MITDPLFYFCAIPAVLIFGLAKGGFGGSVSVVSVPLMALVVSPVQAAAILLPILVVMDAVAIWSFRGQFSKVNLKIIVPAAIVGVVIGAFSFRYLSEDGVRIIIGVISVFFCLNYWFQWPSTGSSDVDIKKGSFWGVVSGFTSFGIHSGGPPISVYLLPQNMDKVVLMGTIAIFFAVVNIVKLIPYAWLDQFDSTNLMTSLVLVPLAPIGVRLGYFLLHKVSAILVYRICYAFLFVAGGNLLVQGLSGYYGSW